MTGIPLFIHLQTTALYLLPEKAVFLPHNQTLVVADLHLGKVNHFRKAGIMIPEGAGTATDYARLHLLIYHYQPTRVIFLGDLFHSEQNASWFSFVQFIQQYPRIEFLLIKGNHDILPLSLYTEIRLNVYDAILQEAAIIYSHAPLEKLEENELNLAGHLHPGVLLQGLGRQSLRLPCFHYTAQCLILPAFGSLTGLHMLNKKNAQQFVITGKSVRTI